MASPCARVSSHRGQLAARAGAALLALALFASAGHAQGANDWERIPLENALIRAGSEPPESLIELCDLANEQLESDPERWHALRAAACFHLLYTANMELRPITDLPASLVFATQGIASLDWQLRNGGERSTSVDIQLCLLGMHLYNTGASDDPELEPAFRAVFEHVEAAYLPTATQMLVEYLQSFVGDDPCLPILEQALERTAELRAAGDLSVLAIDLLFARVALRKGHTAEALRRAESVMNLLLELDPDELTPGNRAQYPSLLIGARENLADAELDLQLNDVVVRENRALLQRTELFRDEASREYLSIQIAMAFVQSDDFTVAERLEALPILEALAASSAVPFRKYLSHCLIGLLALLEGDHARAIESSRQAERMESEQQFTPPTSELALQLAIGLRAHRLAGDPIDEEFTRWQTGLEETIEEWRSEWSEEEHDLGGEGNWLDFRVRFAIAELLVLRAEQQGPGVALETLAQIQSSSALALALGAGAVSADEVQSRLVSPGCGVVACFFGWSTTVDFAIDQAGISWAQTDSSTGLVSESRRFAGAIRLSPTNATPERRTTLVESGRRLSEALFPEPIRARMATWAEVLVVGGDVLAGGTIGALPVLSERPLSVDLAITHSPSFPIAVQLATRADRLEPRPVSAVIAMEAIHGEAARKAFPALGPIRLSDDERADLVDSWPGEVRVLRGAEATWSRTLEACADAEVIELFTHGLSDSALPIPAGFLLSPDAESDGLHWWDAAVAGSVPPWIVLATCASGVGELHLGDEASSDLRGAFLQAGALGIVHTYGNVDQVATHALLVELHRALAKGATLASALCEARAALWSEPRFQDPYFTTLVQVFGVGDRALFTAPALEKESAAPSYLGAALGALAIALILAAIRIRRVRG